jgi:hypothetical protein
MLSLSKEWFATWPKYICALLNLILNIFKLCFKYCDWLFS